ncbi:MAG: PQQ-binding-like beta-propeller repeat protein, partial [Thermoplasmatota archaeon]
MGVRTLKISAIIITIFMISSIYFTICTNISEPVHKGLGYSEEDVLDLPWPRLRGKNRGTGLSPFNTSFVDGSIKWNYSLDGRNSTSPIVGPNSMIYAGSENTLHAVNTKGNLEWSVTIEGNVSDSLTVNSNGTVYFIDDDGKLYAADEDEGIKWSISPDGNIPLFVDSPAIDSDGNIYVHTNRGTLYAVEQNGTVKWKNNVGGSRGSPLAIGENDVIYYATGTNHLNAFYPNGTLKWIYEMPIPRSVNPWPLLLTSPMIDSDDTIYMIGGELNNKGGPFVLLSVNPNGTGRWNEELEGSVKSHPALGPNGNIYFSNESGYFKSYYPNGTHRWTYDVTHRVNNYQTSPSIGSEGTIYFNVIGEREESWSYALNPDGSKKLSIYSEEIMSNNAIGSDGTIYVTSSKSQLYAIGPSSPVINITNPKQNDIFKEKVTVEWESSTVGSTIDHYEIKIDDNSWKNVEGDTSYEFLGLKNGKYTVKVKAVDESRNYHIDFVSFDVDNEGPSLNELDPFKTIYTGETVGIKYNITDESGIEKVHIFYGFNDGKKNNETMVKEGDNYTSDIQVPDTATVLNYTVSAKDNNGNWVKSIKERDVIDNIYPTADAGEDITVKAGDEVTLDASGSSDNIGIYSYEWDFDDGSTVSGKTVEHRFDEKGTYNVTLTVT